MSGLGGARLDQMAGLPPVGDQRRLTVLDLQLAGVDLCEHLGLALVGARDEVEPVNQVGHRRGAQHVHLDTGVGVLVPGHQDRGQLPAGLPQVGFGQRQQAGVDDHPMLRRPQSGLGAVVRFDRRVHLGVQLHDLVLHARRFGLLGFELTCVCGGGTHRGRSGAHEQKERQNDPACPPRMRGDGRHGAGL